MTILLTRKLPDIIIKPLIDAGYQLIEWKKNREMSDKEFIAAAKKADAILFSGHQTINSKFLNACSHLKVIAINSVGYDHVDVEEATKLGIPIGNTPGVLSKATADIAFLLMQMVARKALHNHKRILNGDWRFFNPMKDLGIELQGKTLGIYGLGRIGYELAKNCRLAYSMPVIYHNRGHNEDAERDFKAKRVSFNELLRRSDIISIHANLSNDTAGMFDKKAFEKMKSSAIFINTARGGLHNEKDLKQALKKGIIWGGGLDVTNPEPMKADNPLLNMENCVVLPHIGSATVETRTKMLELCVANLLAGLQDRKLPYCVNPEVYDKK